ncbi:MAG: Gfo/Idh/MocA family oxidoreductase [Acidobacteriaceae bacterium]
MTAQPVRCGVIGFGLAGRIFHSVVIDATPGLELSGIVQRSGDAAQKAYPRVPVYPSLDAMLEKATLDIIVVATPNDTHVILAEQCLRAGKHVVIDKPVAVSSDEAARLFSVMRETGRRVFVYHNRRWDGDFLTVQQLLKSNQLGSVRTFESHFDRFRPTPKPGAWREAAGHGNGILLDLGSHLGDQALVLFGLPTAVWGDVRSERAGSQVDDAFDLRLYYPEITVWLRSTSVSPLPAVRFLVEGTRGSYRKDNLDPQEDALRAGDLFQSTPWGTDPESAWGAITTLNANSATQHTTVPTLPGDYRGFYANVRDTLLGKAEQAVTLLDGWRVLRLLEWARESSEQRAAALCDWSSAPKS